MSDIITVVWLVFSAIVCITFLVFFVYSQNRNYKKLLEVKRYIDVLRDRLEGGR